MRGMKIFIGLTEIAGHYRSLRDGFESIGLECTFVDLFNHPFKYKYDRKKSFFMKLKSLISKKMRTIKYRNFFVKYWWIAWWTILKFIVFTYGIIKYDVFILGFNSSFFGFYDLAILRALKKRIIYRFHGDDVRPAYLSGSFILNKKNFNAAECIKQAYEIKKKVRKIEKFSDVVISNPLFSHFLELPFISATRIGMPCFHSGEQFLRSDKISTNSQEPGRIRVIHAPSNPEVKGTRKVRIAINGLRKSGYPIEYFEIKGKPNDLVLREIANCDFVIDQLYSDTPMSAFVCEAASFSKPAVVGGYAKETFGDIYPSGKIPPSSYCDPSNLVDAIVKLTSDKEYRLELGKKAEEFVNENWAAQKVAQRYLLLIMNKIPQSWWYNPGNIAYLHGAGIIEEKLKEVIRSVIDVGGKEALQLADKPKLEKLLVKFAYS
jgi:hypothetical protein